MARIIGFSKRFISCTVAPICKTPPALFTKPVILPVKRLAVAALAGAQKLTPPRSKLSAKVAGRRAIRGRIVGGVYSFRLARVLVSAATLKFAVWTSD